MYDSICRSRYNSLSVCVLSVYGLLDLCNECIPELEKKL
jgi:hypothetical protein